MRRQVALCALLLWSSAVLAYAAPNVDILDRPLAPLLSRGRPTLVLFANRVTRDAIREPATQMAVRLRDVPFVTLVHIDFRGIPYFFRGLARHKVRDSHHDGVAEYERAFRAVGAEPPADAADRLIFVIDDDGASHQAVGLQAGFNEALAIVLDCQGREVMRAPFPRDLDRVEQAIRNAQCR